MKLKRCKYCGNSLSEDRFPVAATVRGHVYRRLRCQDCYQETKRRRRQVKIAWLEEYKKNCSCQNCGNTDFRVLVFHHRDSKQKDINVSEAVGKWGLKRVKKEIDKCDVLCSNCHLILHYELRQNKQSVA